MNQTDQRPDLRKSYAVFAAEFQRWYNRLAPNGRLGNGSAPQLLSALQALQCLLLCFLLPTLPTAVVLGLTGLVAVLALVLNHRVFAKLGIEPVYPTWRANVPTPREFPKVYTYLAVVVVQVVLTIAWAAMR